MAKISKKEARLFKERTREIEFDKVGALACQMSVKKHCEGGRLDGPFRFRVRSDAHEVHDIYIHYIQYIEEDFFRVGYSYKDYYLKKSNDFQIKQVTPQFVKERKRKNIQPKILQFFTKE